MGNTDWGLIALVTAFVGWGVLVVVGANYEEGKELQEFVTVCDSLNGTVMNEEVCIKDAEVVYVRP